MINYIYMIIAILDQRCKVQRNQDIPYKINVYIYYNNKLFENISFIYRHQRSFELFKDFTLSRSC